jgi:hypothetical protein
MDADYSHPPEYITEFIKQKSNSNADIIVCSRFLKKSKRYYENTNLRPVGIDFLSMFLNKICRIFLFEDFTDYTSGYICIKKKHYKKYQIKRLLWRLFYYINYPMQSSWKQYSRNSFYRKRAS